MLFLLNDHIIELASPEAHLMRRWREMGCGDPRTLRAQDAIEYAKSEVEGFARSGKLLDAQTLSDLAALVVAKTGANSLILKPTASGRLEPRLRTLPQIVLETYQRGAANDRIEQRQFA